MRYLLAIALAAVLAGCGSASKPAPATHRGAVAPHAAELVNYQRNGGLAATLDTVSVRTDGMTRADKRYGGAGRRFDDFHLSATVMARLRMALQRLPGRAPRRRRGGLGRAGATPGDDDRQGQEEQISHGVIYLPGCRLGIRCACR